MRRAEREITDLKEKLKILDACTEIRLGFSADIFPYIVPMNFGFEEKDGRIILYFHGAREGRKAELIKKEPMAAFEADRVLGIVSSETACGYSMKYESVIGGGKITVIENKEQKIYALKKIMEHYTHRQWTEFSPHAVEKAFVFKLTADELTAKGNR